MDFNSEKYFVENSDALTEAEKIQFAKDLIELERQGVIEWRDGAWQPPPASRSKKLRGPWRAFSTKTKKVIDSVPR
jgi:hypothetical protein